MALLRNSFNPQAGSQLFEFTQGIDLDQHLAREEVRVQMAWAEELAALGFLKKEELLTAQRLLHDALGAILNGRFEWKVEDEDIHMNLERYLTENAGDLGKKIHFGRSRNDLIATTLRLFVERISIESGLALRRLVSGLIEKAEGDLETLIPGQTHLQHGQPMRLAHFWLAHAQAFARDVELFDFARRRSVAVMPLGSGALNGVSLSIPLERLQKKLGFAAVPTNSYDLVGDRDFMLDFLRAVSSFGVHLSRLSEDIIIYSSTAVGLFRLPKDYSTGSSMMPNKRNPDVAELSRAKSAHMISSLNHAALLLKGLPLSYNSDLHELKRVLLGALQEFSQCASIFPFFVKGIETNPEVALDLCRRGFVLATFVTENKVLGGATFREAYQETAAEIAAGKSSFESDSPDFAQKLREAVEAKNNCGGTAKAQILRQIEELRAKLSS